MKFHVYQETRQGARHSNQDRIGYLYTKDCAILILCDGMGGHYRGEVAAEFVVHYLAKAFRALAQPTLKEPSQFLFKSIHAAHEALLRYAHKEGMVEVPRTTCVVAVIQDGKVCWAHVGDSRIHLIRDGVLHARSIDHSHVQMLIDANKITQEQAAVHPERNKIFNCMGQPTPPRVDVQKSMPLKMNDYLMLCSDGLWGPVSIPLIVNTLNRCGVGIGVPMLMDLSESLSGRECDNVSAVAFKWMGQAGQPETEDTFAHHRPVSDEDLSMALMYVRGAILGHTVSG